MFERLFTKNPSEQQLPDEAERVNADPETPLQRQLKSEIIKTLKTIYDPEIPVNIYDLGLIYDLQIDVHGQVLVKMTLTTPACPVAQTFPEIVANQIRSIAGVAEVTVDLVWDPPWDAQSISEAARLELGLF